MPSSLERFFLYYSQSGALLDGQNNTI